MPSNAVPSNAEADAQAAVRDYVAAVPSEHRPLFDRLHGLLLAEHPDAAVTISYKIPSYKVGRRRLYLGAWQHGLSVYGWQAGRDGGFTERHPELVTGKGTIRLRPADAEQVDDEELRALFRAALSP